MNSQFYSPRQIQNYFSPQHSNNLQIRSHNQNPFNYHAQKSEQVFTPHQHNLVKPIFIQKPSNIPNPIKNLMQKSDSTALITQNKIGQQASGTHQIILNKQTVENHFGLLSHYSAEKFKNIKNNLVQNEQVKQQQVDDSSIKPKTKKTKKRVKRKNPSNIEQNLHKLIDNGEKSTTEGPNSIRQQQQSNEDLLSKFTRPSFLTFYGKIQNILLIQKSLFGVTLHINNDQYCYTIANKENLLVSEFINALIEEYNYICQINKLIHHPIITFTTKNENIPIDYYLTLEQMKVNVFKGKILQLVPFYKPSTNQYQQVQLKDFKFVKCIGVGGFSRVYLVRKNDSKFYALKLIDKNFILDNNKETIVQNERNIMASLNNPFIVHLQYAFESKYYLVFVLEYCAGGELFYHLRRFKRMTENQAKFYFAEMCIGMMYLHSKHILYRDVKPENVLLDINGHLRIADFGLSKPSNGELANSFCGSPEYMAPEMLKRQGHSYQVDHYCLGALLYELVTGLPPFYCQDTDQIYQSILNEQIEFPQNISLSYEIQDLLLQLLQKEPVDRLGYQFGLQEILSHPWFRGITMKTVQDRALEPPYKPNPIGFNFDEEEFQKGDQEFLNDFYQKQNSCQGRDYGTVFPNFYFEAKQTFTQKQQPSVSQQQQQKVENRESQRSSFQIQQPPLAYYLQKVQSMKKMNFSSSLQNPY